MSNKSEATWHPNSGPVTDHTDLIARLRGMARNEVARDPMGALTAAADALAESVPHESYRALHDQHEATRTHREAAERERDEARAERDALAHVIAQAPHAPDCRKVAEWTHDRCTCYKSIAPAVSLARHDAEVKSQALDEAKQIVTNVCRDVLSDYYGQVRMEVNAALDSRAAAIRAEAE